MIISPRILLASITCLFLLATSCTKKETMEVDNETQSAVDYAIADQEFMGVISAAARSAITLTTSGAQTSYFVPTSYSMSDGKERTVELISRGNGLVKDPGTQTVFKIRSYTAAGIDYNCDSIIMTTIESNNIYSSFNVKLINGTSKTQNYNIKYGFERTFTIYPVEDQYSLDVVTHVYGTAFGTNRTGRNFSTTVSQETPLIKRTNCAYIGSGTMELTPEGFKSRTINFGNGDCDDQATFTVKENTVAFKLK